MPRDHLQIDLADPDDIRAKLPEAEALLETKQKAARDAQREYETLRDLVAHLKAVAGVEDLASVLTTHVAKQTRRRKASPAQDATVAVVNDAGRLIGPTEVAELLIAQGKPVASVNAVNSALYAAAQNDRIQHMPNEGYAPLGWTQPDDQLPASPNGTGEAQT